jgi:putative MATE family efflux protein
MTTPDVVPATAPELAPAPAAPPAAPPPPASIWSTIRDALRGAHYDFTDGPIPRAIILLAVPMVLEMALESVFAVTDIFFVGRLGPDAVATVGLTESMLAIIYAVDMGFAIGAAATVARRIGERDPEGAADAAMQSLWLGLAAAVIIGSIGAIFGPALLQLMGASPGVLAHANYTRVMLGGSGTIVMLFLLNAIFRGAGDAAIAMRVLWLANTINILLGPCLIFGLGPFPRLGVAGAAVATTIGRGTGALYAASRLLRPGGRVHLQRRHVRIDPAGIGRLLRLSGASGLQSLIGTASWVGLVRIISQFGSQALAGYTIGIRIVVFALLPSWGLGNAAATMVGQALGAKKPERASRAVWLAAGYDCAFLTLVGLGFLLLARPIVGLFTSDPTVLEIGGTALRTMAVGFPFFGVGMVLTQSFNGAGDTRTPTLINLFVFWLWEIPLAGVLALRTSLGPTGVFLAVTIAFATLAVVSGILFRRGRWRTSVV